MYGAAQGGAAATAFPAQLLEGAHAYLSTPCPGGAMQGDAHARTFWASIMQPPQ